MEQNGNKAKRFLTKVKNAVFSKKGVIVSGIVSFLYIASMIALLSQAGVVYFNPGLFCGDDYASMRRVVVQNGQLSETPGYTECLSFGVDYYGVAVEEAGVTYHVYTGAKDINSNFFSISTFETHDDYGVYLSFATGWFVDGGFEEDRDYAFYAQVIGAKQDGTPYAKKVSDVKVVADVAFSSTAQYELIKAAEITSDLETDMPKEIAAKINANAETYLRSFFPKIKPTLSKLGNFNFDAAIKGIRTSLEWSRLSSLLLFLNAVISLVGGPCLCVFLASSIVMAKKRKQRKLIAQGVLPDPDAPPLEEVTEDSPLPPSDLDLPRRDPFERFVAKTHLRPVLGEWVIRGLGLALVMIGAVITKLINNGVIVDSSNALYPIFRTLAMEGRFLLVVAIIGIVAETRKGLTLTSAFFFSLALTYYFAVNSILLFLDSAIKTDFGGISFSTYISSLLPGNIFLSIGLFAFLGFFLFEEPPEWFINRKVFRALSAIPTGIAFGSVVFSLLSSGGVIAPNYWVSSLLFVRDFDGLFVGILFEFSLFAFRSICRKKYGEGRLDAEMERPAMQFKKNLALCAIILLFVAIFYAFPKSWKAALQLPDHTFVYVLIPLFLFYKPAGKNRNRASDIVYYALYVFALALPTLVMFMMGR